MGLCRRERVDSRAMYESLHIQGFRGLEDVRFDALRRVNLIVGRNNSGKTSLLEAIVCLGQATSPEVLLTLARLRGQKVERRSVDATRVILPFFGGLDAEREASIMARWAGEPADRRLRITAGTGKPAGDLGGEDGAVWAVDDQAMVSVRFDYQDAAGVAMSAELDLSQEGPRSPAPDKRSDFVRTVMVSPRARPLEKDAQQFDYLARTKNDGPVLRAVQMLDSRIAQLRTGNHMGSPTVDVDIGLGQYMPLAVCGDGVVRLFSFVVALTSVPRGALLIDEMDAGLHYSTMTDAWRTLRALAEEQRVQVFATTHNEELIRHALRAFPGDLSWLGLYRLDRVDRGVVTVAYDEETLEAVRDRRFEVRG